MKSVLTPSELIAQQTLLAELGFYKGKIDGIWSTETIKAKLAFERSREFPPALPNNGMPFMKGDKLPRLIRHDGTSYIHPKKPTAPEVKPAPVAKQEPKPEPVKVEQKSEAKDADQN